MFLLAGALFASKPPTLVVFLLGLLLLLDREGLSLGAFAAELRGLLFLIVFAFLIEGLGWERGPRLLPEGLGIAALYSLRLVAAFALGRLFYQTTPGSELREAAGLLGRLIPGRLGEDLALALALVLGFLPDILGEWRLSLEAGQARGIHRGSGPGLRLRVVEAFIRRLILDALSLPEILVARGWTGAPPKHPVPWGKKGFAVVVSSAVLLATSLAGLL
jgi:energy-coupling factor transporter transmembrane protein EcfT